MRARIVAVTLLLLLVLVPPDVIAATADAVTLKVDYRRSSIAVRTGKAGVFGFLGHAHGILATAWRAEIEFDEARPSASRLTVETSVADLVIDSAAARRKARLSGRSPNEEEIGEIQVNMLDADHLDAASHATIRFATTAVTSPKDNTLVLEGLLTIHGVTQEVSVPVKYKRLGKFLHFAGEVKVGQRDFGIDPESIGGVVKVANEVRILIDIWTLDPKQAGG